VVDPPSCLSLIEVSAAGVRRGLLDTLDSAIKARGLAIGDVDGDGRAELAVGTRGLDVPGYDETSLSCYKHDPGCDRWVKETVARSGPWGFHCVALADLDGDGCAEIVASDDGMGQVAWYRRTGEVWRRRVVVDRPARIFTTRIDMIAV
jgi:hypothetical protein